MRHSSTSLIYGLQWPSEVHHLLLGNPKAELAFQRTAGISYDVGRARLVDSLGLSDGVAVGKALVEIHNG